MNSLQADAAFAIFKPGPLGFSVGAGGVLEVNSEGTHADYFEDVVLDDQVPARVSLAWELPVEYSEEWVAVDPEAEAQLLRTYDSDEAAVLADRLEKLAGALYRDSDGQIAEDLDAVEQLSESYDLPFVDRDRARYVLGALTALKARPMLSEEVHIEEKAVPAELSAIEDSRTYQRIDPADAERITAADTITQWQGYSSVPAPYSPVLPALTGLELKDTGEAGGSSKAPDLVRVSEQAWTENRSTPLDLSGNPGSGQPNFDAGGSGEDVREVRQSDLPFFNTEARTIGAYEAIPGMRPGVDLRAAAPATAAGAPDGLVGLSARGPEAGNLGRVVDIAALNSAGQSEPVDLIRVWLPPSQGWP